MSAVVKDHLLKMREERAAREKARLDKLRELNLKKYTKIDQPGDKASTHKLVKANSVSQLKYLNAPVKNNFYVNGTTKRPLTAPVPKAKDVTKDVKTLNEPKEVKTNYLHKNIVALQNADRSKAKVIDKKENKEPNFNAVMTNDSSKVDKKPINLDKNKHKINNDKLFDRKTLVKADSVLAEIKPFKAIDPKLTRKSMGFSKSGIPAPSRKSMIPKIDTEKESVFERLYKPKCAPKKTLDEVEKLKTDPHYFKKVIKNSGLILKRHHCAESKEVTPVRRSISAFHFKRISKDEANKCIQKWSSIGDKLNNRHLTIDEEEPGNESVVSAVKSERKKVTFLTPKANTPGPHELQARLKSWLKKRGKSLDAYQHLQCFGIHHLHKPSDPVIRKFDTYDEENKENVAMDSDSDNDSYSENVADKKDLSCFCPCHEAHTAKDAFSAGDNADIDKWRPNESIQTEFSDAVDLNETTVTADTVAVDDVLIGALNDLTELIKEGFECEQAARYLRAIRARYPDAPRVAAYWECRAALEEKRGDLYASVQCWEEAIAKGTEHKVADANLDTLLNKFMQLNISPRAAAAPKHPDPKMVDVKNVFKSAIIRFAVTKAKLQQSEVPVYHVTPVRRSGRLSSCPTPRQNTPRATPRPLHICESVKQVSAIAPKHVFTVNEHLVLTP